MNIEKVLNENLETFYPWNAFYPWGDDENPPLDARKDFVQKEKELDEFFEGWRASM